MTETYHAFRGMCQNRPALIFCQLFHRSTVPTMPRYYHVTMSSVPTIPPCHRSDSVIILQCHHSTVSSFYSVIILVSSFYSIFVLFHHRAGLPIVSNNHYSNNETVQTRKSFQRIIIPEYDPKVCCIKVCVGALPTL